MVFDVVAAVAVGNNDPDRFAMVPTTVRFDQLFEFSTTAAEPFGGCPAMLAHVLVVRAESATVARGNCSGRRCLFADWIVLPSIRDDLSSADDA